MLPQSLSTRSQTRSRSLARFVCEPVFRLKRVILEAGSREGGAAWWQGHRAGRHEPSAQEAKPEREPVCESGEPGFAHHCTRVFISFVRKGAIGLISSLHLKSVKNKETSSVERPIGFSKGDEPSRHIFSGQVGKHGGFSFCTSRSAPAALVGLPSSDPSMFRGRPPTALPAPPNSRYFARKVCDSRGSSGSLPLPARGRKRDRALVLAGGDWSLSGCSLLSGGVERSRQPAPGGLRWPSQGLQARVRVETLRPAETVPRSLVSGRLLSRLWTKAHISEEDESVFLSPGPGHQQSSIARQGRRVLSTVRTKVLGRIWKEGFPLWLSTVDVLVSTAFSSS